MFSSNVNLNTIKLMYAIQLYSVMHEIREDKYYMHHFKL